MCLVVPACCLKTLRYCGVVTRVMYEQTQQRETWKAGTGTHSRQGRQGGQGCGRRRKEGARSETRAADGPEGEIAFCCSRHLAYTALSLSVSLSLSLPLSLLLCSFFTMRLTAHWADSGRAFFLFPFSFFPFPCQPPPPPPPSPLLSSPTPIPLPTYLCPPSLNGLLRNRVVLVVLVLVTCNTPKSRREKRNLSTQSSHTPSTK